MGDKNNICMLGLQYGRGKEGIDRDNKAGIQYWF